MRFTILHHGVPLGTVELEPADLSVGELAPTPAYAAVRPVIRDASAALWTLGFLSEWPPTSKIDPTALARAQALSLELRDPTGALVPVDFINVVERPDAADLPVVFSRFRQAAALSAAALTRARSDAGNRAPADA